MDDAWPEPVERVAAFLREAGAEARIEQFGTAAHTAAAAAEAVGCTLEQIVKSIVLVCDRRPVVALVPGDRRCDTAKVARHVGAAGARVATAEEVAGTTGFLPGGVAPFPLPQIDHVLVERTLLSSPVVWVGAGSDRHLAGLSPLELLRLTRGEPVDVVQESA